MLGHWRVRVCVCLCQVFIQLSAVGYCLPLHVSPLVRAFQWLSGQQSGSLCVCVCVRVRGVFWRYMLFIPSVCLSVPDEDRAWFNS